MSAGRGNRFSRVLGKILLAAAAAAVGLLAAEGLVRLLAPQPIVPRFVESAPWGIRQNLPNVDGTHSTAEYEYRFTTGPQGFRSQRNYSEQVPAGVRRVAVLGDSVTLGHGVRDEETFSARLEALLAGSGQPAEVINMGVSGFGTAEELIHYQNVARRFHPDVVVVAYFQNDPLNNFICGLFRVEGGRLVRQSSGFLPGVTLRDSVARIPGYEWLVQHSHLVNLVRNTASLLISRRYAAEAARRAGSGSADASAGAANGCDAGSADASAGAGDGAGAGGAETPQDELTLRLLEALAREVADDGARIVLLDIASSAEGFRTSFPRTLSLPDSARVVSATPELKKSLESGQRIFYPVDGHPTAEGHDAIAAALFPVVLEMLRSGSL